jgi:hypothetical protein
MLGLTGLDIVHIWEAGVGQHPLDRALTILLEVFQGATREQLASLSIGQRDSCLFAVREQTFGPRLSSLASCPACQEQVEFALNIEDIPLTPHIHPVEQVFELKTNASDIHFRLPNSLDLAAIVDSQEPELARGLLARRCLIKADNDGEELDETLIAAMAAQMEVCDPLAAIDIPLDCPNCGHQWQPLFDIVSFFWTEIASQARRLLREVHTLARYYGWREADILAMSAIRRQFYLEMGAEWPTS